MSATGTRVTVAVYGQSPLTQADETALLTDTRLGLGEHEDLTAFYAFGRSDEVLSVAINDLYGMRVGRLDDLFGRVILAITLQMAPLKRSETMIAKPLEQYGTKMNFDGKEVVLWPRPSDIARLSPSDLRREVHLGYRAERLVQSARYLIDHPLSLRALCGKPETEAIRNVMEIPGIGRYSAGLILGRSSVPIDVWSVVIMSELLRGHAQRIQGRKSTR